MSTESVSQTIKKYGIAITGGIASGKSSATFILKQLGFLVIDADLLAHQCLMKGTESYKAVVGTFTNKILEANEEISRPLLGNIIFADLCMKKKLEAILHPFIRKRFYQLVARHTPKNYFFYDAALIFETNSEDDFLQTWLIACSREIQLYRLITKRGLTEKQAIQRIRAQMPISAKVNRTHHIIWNESYLSDLKKSLTVATYNLRRGP